MEQHCMPFARIERRTILWVRSVGGFYYSGSTTKAHFSAHFTIAVRSPRSASFNCEQFTWHSNVQIILSSYMNQFIKNVFRVFGNIAKSPWAFWRSSPSHSLSVFFQFFMPIYVLLTFNDVITLLPILLDLRYPYCVKWTSRCERHRLVAAGHNSHKNEKPAEAENRRRRKEKKNRSTVYCQWRYNVTGECRLSHDHFTQK